MKRRAAFTLIELLVVVAIITLLLSVLLPALGDARRRGRQVVCLSNLKQIGVLFTYYAEDHAGMYPAAKDPISTTPDYYWLWMGRGFRRKLVPYLKGVSEDKPYVLYCPSDASTDFEKTSYAYSMAFYHSPEQINTLSEPNDAYFPNAVLPAVAQKLSHVRWPARKILSGEWTSNHKAISPDPGWWGWQGQRNFLLADGHARSIDANDIQPANDDRPDANLTKDGVKGYDVGS